MMSRLQFRDELKARGFDAFTDAQLNRYIQWAVDHINRTARWLWERQTTELTLGVGKYLIEMGGATNLMPNGSFEDGTVGPWLPHGALTTIVVFQGNGADGQYFLQINANANTHGTKATFERPQGEGLKIRFAIRPVTVTAINLLLWAGDNQLYQLGTMKVLPIVTNGQWQRFEYYYTPEELGNTSMVNMFLQVAAPVTPSGWELDDVQIQAGISDVDAVEMGAFGGVRGMWVTTANQRRQLDPLSKDRFYNDYYAALPPAGAQEYGEPQYYYVENNRIYVVPAARESRTVRIDYDGRELKLLKDSDTPDLPDEFEELVMIGSMMRAHQRARDWNEAQLLRRDLDEGFIDLLNRQALVYDEEPERVIPDNRWL